MHKLTVEQLKNSYIDDDTSPDTITLGIGAPNYVGLEGTNVPSYSQKGQVCPF